jgi:hypothetical protein
MAPASGAAQNPVALMQKLVEAGAAATEPLASTNAPIANGTAPIQNRN